MSSAAFCVHQRILEEAAGIAGFTRIGQLAAAHGAYGFKYLKRRHRSGIQLSQIAVAQFVATVC